MSFKIVSSKGRHKVVASQGLQKGLSPSGSMMTTSTLVGADLKDGMLSGLFDENSPQAIQAIYRDIYYHDPIAGAAVDLKATMPWSDFTITGATEEQLKIFNESIERLNLKSLHVEMSIDQMVSGAFIGSLIHKNNELTDIVPFDYAYATIHPNLLYSEDPSIQITISDDVRAYANSKVPGIVDSHKRMPTDLLNMLKTAKEIDLDPLTTLYLPRTSLSTVQTGISYFRRIVPIYLLERVLYRGTISEAQRRQRSTLHVTAGNEDWVPTSNELSDLVALFQMAEMDPISAVVATRDSIQTNEIRSAGDFWRWTDVAEQLSYAKMRALGINESFLSGESTYGTMEMALSVFIEDLRTYRERETRRIYYDKIFPLISVVNNFKKEDIVTANRNAMFSAINDKDNLVIPEIHWHKQLRPEADQDYLGILTTLEEKGIPVPLRMWAAAGGYDLDKILDDKEADVEIAKKIADYQEAVNNNINVEEASLRVPLTTLATSYSGNWYNRNFDQYNEIVGTTKTGKPKYIHNQKKAQAKANEMGAKALKALADESHLKQVAKKARGK